MSTGQGATAAGAPEYPPALPLRLTGRIGLTILPDHPEWAYLAEPWEAPVALGPRVNPWPLPQRRTGPMAGWHEDDGEDQGMVVPPLPAEAPPPVPPLVLADPDPSPVPSRHERLPAAEEVPTGSGDALEVPRPGAEPTSPGVAGTAEAGPGHPDEAETRRELDAQAAKAAADEALRRAGADPAVIAELQHPEDTAVLPVPEQGEPDA